MGIKEKVERHRQSRFFSLDKHYCRVPCWQTQHNCRPNRIWENISHDGSPGRNDIIERQCSGSWRLKQATTSARSTDRPHWKRCLLCTASMARQWHGQGEYPVWVAFRPGKIPYGNCSMCPRARPRSPWRGRWNARWRERYRSFWWSKTENISGPCTLLQLEASLPRRLPKCGWLAYSQAYFWRSDHGKANAQPYLHPGNAQRDTDSATRKLCGCARQWQNLRSGPARRSHRDQLP